MITRITERGLTVHELSADEWKRLEEIMSELNEMFACASVCLKPVNISGIGRNDYAIYINGALV